jgi:hypothetical protein
MVRREGGVAGPGRLASRERSRVITSPAGVPFAQSASASARSPGQE